MTIEANNGFPLYSLHKPIAKTYAPKTVLFATLPHPATDRIHNPIKNHRRSTQDFDSFLLGSLQLFAIAPCRVILCRLKRHFLFHDQHLPSQRTFHRFRIRQSNVLRWYGLVPMKPFAIPRYRNIQYTRTHHVYSKSTRHLYCRAFDETGQRTIGCGRVRASADWVAI